MPMIPITTNPPSNQQQSNPSKKGGLFKRIKKKKSSKENSSNNDMVVAPSNSIPSISTDPQDPYRMKEFFSTVPGLRSKIKKLSKLMDEYDQVYYQVLTAIDDKETNSKKLINFHSFAYSFSYSHLSIFPSFHLSFIPFIFFIIFSLNF